MALDPYRDHYYRCIGDLCRENRVSVVVVEVPHESNPKDSCSFRVDWERLLGEPVWRVGLPRDRLYDGLDRSDLQELYYNDHLNFNGNAHFTRVIAPALWRGLDDVQEEK